MSNKEIKAQIGAKLRQTREEKDLDLQTVHEVTKVPLDALRAIEEGYNIGSMSEFYFRSFVRMYAQFLNLNSNELLAPLGESEVSKAKAPKSKKQESKFNEQKINKVVSKLLGPKQIEKYVAVVVLIIGVFIIFQVFGFIGRVLFKPKDKPKVAAVEKSKEDKKKEKKKEEKKKEQEQRAVSASVVPPARSLKPSVSASKELPVSLTVHATRSTWMRVKVDGDMVFQGVLKKGVVENWQASDEIELTGKKIGYLELEVNGDVVGKLGRANLKAKKITVTKDGMKVEK